MSTPPLRRGWTTGACATAAAKAAYIALLTGDFLDPVPIVLPIGVETRFALSERSRDEERASVAIVKDAGDDPDVTHGASIVATVTRGAPGSGVTLRAGPGVGVVTKPGLPVSVGEPAINPVPCRMIGEAIADAARELRDSGDVVVEISIPGGEALARKTMNPRLGIVGGLSILGTTGIVVPYSCSAWIASVHEGIDVARATGLTHIAGSTGATSERAVARRYDLPDSALIEMGDFVGAMLRYIRRKPVPRVTIAGGFAKLAKLAQGHLDLHSHRGSLDLARLGALAAEHGASEPLAAEIANANTGLQAWELARDAKLPLADAVAARARATAAELLADTAVTLDVLVVDREGAIIGAAQ